VLESVFLMTAVGVLLGGCIFKSAVFQAGDALHWAVTLLVLAMVAAAAALFVCMVVLEVRRSLRGAALRETAATMRLARATPRRVTVDFSVRRVTVNLRGEIVLGDWHTNPLRADRAGGGGGRVAPAAAHAASRGADDGPAVLAEAALVLATERAVVALQAVARGRIARARARARVRRLYRSVRDEDTGALWYFNTRTGTASWARPPLLLERDVVEPYE
jgi:hypothetical protein